MHHEDSACDAVGRARRDSAVAEDRAGYETRHVHSGSPVVAAADEDAAAPHRGTGSTGREAGQVGRDRHRGVSVLVPEREGTQQDLDAVALGPVVVAARISRHDVDVMRFDVAPAHGVGRKQLNDAGDLQVLKLHPSERGLARLVEQRPAVHIRDQRKRFDGVVPRQPDAINARGERDPSVPTLADQALGRGKVQRWNPRE